MISVQSAMLVALGFLAASLLGLIVASAFWSRAVRLTTARIKQSMPVSEPEIKADRDRLRAEYAIRVHKLEMELEQAKLARARQLIDINRREASIATLESSVTELKADLEENQNARRVLEQTVADRLPRVEARLAEAKRLLFNRDREIAELSATAKRNKQALEDATSINAQTKAQIDRLSSQSGRGRSGGEASEGEQSLRTELDALRSKSSEQALLIDRLQRHQGHGHALASAASPRESTDRRASAEGARQEILEAEAVLDPARANGAGKEGALQRDIRALTAKTEDQAGEIARLKAALGAFEQQGGEASGLKNSKIALKARLGSAQAQADQQASTIAKLRSELASTHERLAKQAAHFMGEMRRIGSGSANRRPAPNPDRGSLLERVAQVRAGSAARGQAGGGESPAPAPANGKDLEAANDRSAGTNGHASNGVAGSGEASHGTAPLPAADTAVIEDAVSEDAGAIVPVSKEAVSEDAKGPPAAAPTEVHVAEAVEPEAAAPQLPQPSEIPEQRRRPRLMDRITGTDKG